MCYGGGCRSLGWTGIRHCPRTATSGPGRPAGWLIQQYSPETASPSHQRGLHPDTRRGEHQSRSLCVASVRGCHPVKPRVLDGQVGHKRAVLLDLINSINFDKTASYSLWIMIKLVFGFCLCNIILRACLHSRKFDTRWSHCLITWIVWIKHIFIEKLK